tara:strand:+ start:162 stop:701 length:540 start_codon:yes stop_codon:yes gene_type:complete
MATIDALRRQPEKFDYTQNSQFLVTLGNFPMAQYFCTTLTVPGVSVGRIDTETSLATLPMVGEQMEFEDFTMTFMVDETLANYREIFNWIVNIGAPSDHAQFLKTERADGLDLPGDRNLYSEIQISILSSKNNPVVRTTLHDAFPLSLSGLTYTTQETDAVYLTADVTFAYSYYEFLAL